MEKVLAYINRYSWVRDIHFYTDHEVDTIEIVLQIGWKDCDLLSESEDEQVRKVIREIVNECEPVTAPVTENQPENDPEIANSPVTETHPESHPEPEHEHFSEFETQPEVANDTEFHFSTQCSNMNVDTTATAPTSGIGGCPAGYQSQEEEGVEGNDNGEEGDDSSEEENDASPPDERVRYEGSQPQGSFTLGMTFANAKLARDECSKI